MDQYQSLIAPLPEAFRDLLLTCWRAGQAVRLDHPPHEIPLGELADQPLQSGDVVTGLKGGKDIDKLERVLAFRTGLTAEQYECRNWYLRPLSHMVRPPKFVGELSQTEVLVLATGLDTHPHFRPSRPNRGSVSCYLVITELRSTGRGQVGVSLRFVSYWRFGNSVRRYIATRVGVLASAHLAEQLNQSAHEKYVSVRGWALARAFQGGLPGSGR